MRLVKVQQATVSRTLFEAYRLGPWELGHCVAWRDDNPALGTCSNLVLDDGTGYADIDGEPFKAYVCKHCAPRFLTATQGE
jgi:hypothetical protein